jgi:hypothetical protein
VPYRLDLPQPFLGPLAVRGAIDPPRVGQARRRPVPAAAFPPPGWVNNVGVDVWGYGPKTLAEVLDAVGMAE